MEAEQPAVEEEVDVEAVCEAVEAVTTQPTEEEVSGGRDEGVMSYGGVRCLQLPRLLVIGFQFILLKI